MSGKRGVQLLNHPEDVGTSHASGGLAHNFDHGLVIPGVQIALGRQGAASRWLPLRFAQAVSQ